MGKETPTMHRSLFLTILSTATALRVPAGLGQAALGGNPSAAVRMSPASGHACVVRMQVTTSLATSVIRPDLAATMGNEPTAGMADEAALLARSSFPIPPDELILLAKAFTAAQLAGTQREKEVRTGS